MIHYVQGRITILDRLSLESAACEGYGAVRRHDARTLGSPTPG